MPTGARTYPPAARRATHSAVPSARPNGEPRSSKAELQRLLGDQGTILPRQMAGTIDQPAAGWYAVMASDGEVRYLGDRRDLAVLAIDRLSRAHA
jgi:hypothetical protein